MAITTRTPITAEEFLERHAGQGAFELVKGEVVELSPGMPEHGRICTKVGFLLESFGRESGYGYVLSNDTAILTERSPDTARGADLCFFSRARLPEAELQPRIAAVAPDVVVEVYSPSNRPAEMRAKVNEYLNVGVRMVWVVYPARRSVAIYRADEPIPSVFAGSDVLENLPELPGFRCQVSEFFP